MEIVSVVNSKPFTYVYDVSGVTYTLSPSHLIYERRITNTPNRSHFEVISTNDTYKTSEASQTSEPVYKWRQDYLLNLRENHASKSKEGNGCEIARGDVVLLRSDSNKRTLSRSQLISSIW